jgi:hypothetical protein
VLSLHKAYLQVKSGHWIRSQAATVIQREMKMGGLMTSGTTTLSTWRFKCLVRGSSQNTLKSILDCKCQSQCRILSTKTLCSYRSRKRRNVQTWSARIQSVQSKWDAQLPSLIDSFLQYKRSGGRLEDDQASGTAETFTLLLFDVYGMCLWLGMYAVLLLARY